MCTGTELILTSLISGISRNPVLKKDLFKAAIFRVCSNRSNCSFGTNDCIIDSFCLS